MTERVAPDYRPRDMALSLMRSALDLLAASGDEIACCHLQTAICFAGEDRTRYDPPTKGPLGRQAVQSKR